MTSASSSTWFVVFHGPFGVAEYLGDHIMVYAPKLMKGHHYNAGYYDLLSAIPSTSKNLEVTFPGLAKNGAGSVLPAPSLLIEVPKPIAPPTQHRFSVKLPIPSRVISSCAVMDQTALGIKFSGADATLTPQLQQIPEALCFVYDNVVAPQLAGHAWQYDPQREYELHFFIQRSQNMPMNGNPNLHLQHAFNMLAEMLNLDLQMGALPAEKLATTAGDIPPGKPKGLNPDHVWDLPSNPVPPPTIVPPPPVGPAITCAAPGIGGNGG